MDDGWGHEIANGLIRTGILLGIGVATAFWALWFLASWLIHHLRWVS